MSSSPYLDQLDQLFLTSPEQAAERCQQHFKERTRGEVGPLLLWGCGPLGALVAKNLKGSKFPVGGFIDRNRDLWGKTYEGHPVIAPESLREEPYRHSLVILTVYTSAPLRKLLTEWGISFLTFPELAWGMPERFLPHCCLDRTDVFHGQKEAARSALNGWADDTSCEEYLGQLKWRMSLDYAVLPTHLSAKETYFPSELVSLQPDEHYVDCGAFDGDSVRELLARTDGHFNRITAFEPDKISYERLVDYVRTLPASTADRVRLFNKGLGDKTTDTFLNQTGTVTSTVGESGAPISLVTLDSVLLGEAPTYLKMDVEGFEPFALRGGAAIFQKYHPVLAICLYHAFDHLWSIPNYLHSLVPEYQLYLRRHSDECWESICYAVPLTRTKPGKLS